MLDAPELVRLVVNKSVVSEKRGRGRKGYGRCPAVRLLVYAQLRGIHRDKNLEKFLRKNRGIAIALGLDGVPDRTTIGRWKRRLNKIVKQVFEKVSNIIQMLSPTKDLVVDSTPLEDPQDPDARWGKSSRGWFKGYKAHLAVNQDGLVLKAKITTGNRYDSPFLPELVKGFNPDRVLADAGYDSEKNRKTCRELGAEVHIAKNPRNSGEEYELSEILKEKRSVVERFNSRLKELLKKSWQGPRGLTKTKTIIYTALIAMTTIAIQALLSEKSDKARKINLYRN